MGGRKKRNRDVGNVLADLSTTFGDHMTLHVDSRGPIVANPKLIIFSMDSRFACQTSDSLSHGQSKHQPEFVTSFHTDPNRNAIVCNSFSFQKTHTLVKLVGSSRANAALAILVHLGSIRCCSKLVHVVSVFRMFYFVLNGFVHPRKLVTNGML